MSDNIQVKNTTLYALGIILLISIVGGYVIVGGHNSLTESFVGKVIQGNSNEDAQEIVLGVKNYNYYPNTVTVKAGKLVRIYLDSSVVGCLRAFTIKDFGIAKNLPTPNDYVEFTPTKKGTYKFACSMGMGTGILIVE